MRIIHYNNCNDIVIEFQDQYKAKIHTKYNNFLFGKIKNPYFASVNGVGISGNKYPISVNGKSTKEYEAWQQMLCRCFDEELKERNPTYKEVDCCSEWLLFENFYEWLHSQENFDKWLNGERWAIDKDIIIKGNKVYSPDVCCLVPHNVNSLFTKCDASRGDMCIGVYKQKDKFLALCHNPFTNKREYYGSFETQKQAFEIYKKHKEDIIKQVAQIEYDNKNIIKKCYDAMMNYQVEIVD